MLSQNSKVQVANQAPWPCYIQLVCCNNKSSYSPKIHSLFDTVLFCVCCIQMGRNYIQLSKKMTRAKTNKRLRSILLQAQAIETHDDNACHTIAFSKIWNILCTYKFLDLFFSTIKQFKLHTYKSLASAKDSLLGRVVYKLRLQEEMGTQVVQKFQLYKVETVNEGGQVVKKSQTLVNVVCE